MKFLMGKRNYETRRKKIDIAVIGGGASGLAAAISAAKLGTERENPLHITILERQDRVAKKLLATGTGAATLRTLAQKNAIITAVM